MGGEVGTAAVEGEVGPAAAKGGNAAVAVLEVEEPGHAGNDGVAHAWVRIGRGWRGEVSQREERAGGVVGVGDATGEIGPRPAAGRGVGVGVDGAVLLVKEPVAEIGEGGGGEMFRGVVIEGVDGEGGDPGGEVGVDGPTAVGAERGKEEVEAGEGDGMGGVAAAGEAHGDEAGEGSGFEKSAAGGLDFGEDAEGFVADEVAEQAGDGIAGRSMVVAGLTDGNEGRQGVTDDGQAEGGEEILWQGGEFEGQGNDAAPGVGTGAEASRKGAHRENGDGEGAVFAVAGDDGANERRAVEDGGGGRW